jgi:hypothetical protein
MYASDALPQAKNDASLNSLSITLVEKNLPHYVRFRSDSMLEFLVPESGA